MKLHWSPRSPYVRKVMIAAHELGLAERIDRVRSVAVRTRLNPDIVADSPVGRIPALVLDDGTVLSGSLTVCDYLDAAGGGQRLFPPPGEARWQELELHGVADGLIDILILWRNERDRLDGERSDPLCATALAKTGACLDWLERAAPAFAGRPYAIGLITVGCALGYLDFRFDDLDWRYGRPRLTDWFRWFEARPSSIATGTVDDG